MLLSYLQFIQTLQNCVDGKIKYTNFGHEKYTTLRHKNWAALATKYTA